MKPVSLRPCRNPATNGFQEPAEPALRNPTTGLCCASALSGQVATAAAPAALRNSRRLMPSAYPEQAIVQVRARVLIEVEYGIERTSVEAAHVAMGQTRK